MGNEDILLVNASVGDLAKALAYHLGLALSDKELGTVDDPKKEVKKHYVYGYQGLCDFLKIGKTSVYKLLKSGVIDAAVTQKGKILIVDSDMVLDLLKVHKKNRRIKR